MLIWRGWGGLVAVFAVAGLLLVSFAGQAVFGHRLSANEQRVCSFLGLAMAAAAVYVLDLALKRRDPPRTLIDPKNGAPVTLVAKHDLFFVPVRYWPWLLGVAAFAVLLFGG